MKDEIDNGTAIWFKAQPTCNVKRTCEECVQLKVINSVNNDQYFIYIILSDPIDMKSNNYLHFPVQLVPKSKTL